ncbi:MAG: ABC transporter substrate-binding protein [Propionibacteriaceae bacterium]|nr:ABC transporter substrate-binding protein [Propionibacteriaceae bacterium]
MSHRYALSGLVLLAGAALLLSGCSPDATSSPSTGTAASSGAANVQLVKPGTLTVCTNPPFKPMEYDDSTGQTVGFDIDLMQLVADKLGAQMSVLETDFSQITSGAVFAARQCDIGASAITITDARKKAVLFSTPYFAATQALVVKTDSGINDLSGMKGKTVAVQTDTTGNDYANSHASTDGYQVKVFDDAGTALNSILAGSADGCLIDRAIAYSFVADNPTTKVVTEFQTGEQYGFDVSLDNTALINVVNQVLTTANTDGTYLSLYKKWIDPSATSASLPTATA